MYLYLFFILYSIQHKFEIQGNSRIGYYQAKFYIGSNKEPKFLILDTGSNLTVFPCKDCDNCGEHETQLYDNEASKSFQFIKPDNKYLEWTCSAQEN